MMKKDIRTLNFGAIAGWRGDSMVCPQAFGGDVYAGCSMGCWWCFCREMEEGLYNRYYEGWTRDLVRPCNPEDYERLFDQAFGSDKETKNWLIQCLREGLPFNMGSKAETFCPEDFQLGVTDRVLKTFLKYRVPVIFETKSHLIGLRRYLDIIQEMGPRAAVIVAVMGGSDTLNYKLEPGCAMASSRWQLIADLNRKGIWTAARWEPIMAGINSSPDILQDFADKARQYGAKHVSFYNYRTSNWKIAKKEFESRGFNYVKMLEGNLDENWKPVGARFFDMLRRAGVPASTPDFVNFPLDSDCVSCCGTDSLFKPYNFNFQYACSIVKKKGWVEWDDMEAVTFREPEAYERMKKGWNGDKGYFTMVDAKGIVVLDRDRNGRNIYGLPSGTPPKQEPSKKKGLFL